MSRDSVDRQSHSEPELKQHGDSEAGPSRSGYDARRVSRSLLEREHALLQKRANGSTARETPHAAAERGIATPATTLPHAERIQASFGPAHDVSAIKAHVGGDSATSMGATAYATGTDVVFDRQPDLHTAAHEAAHVVQQSRGIHLYGGVGEEHDEHEHNADAVADRVVAGESAADLLAPSGSCQLVQPGKQIQHKKRSNDPFAVPEQVDARTEAPGAAYGDAEQIILHAREFAQTTTDTLLPAFRRAVDALDAPAALQLAQACVRGLGAVVSARDLARERTRSADPTARAQCKPGDAFETPGVMPEAWEIDLHKQLEGSVHGLELDVAALGRRVALEMSPQIFRGVVVGSGMQYPPGVDANPVDAAVRESSTTVDLVVTCAHIRQLLGTEPALASKDKKKEAVSKLEMARSRPINFQFLKRALIEESLWNALASEVGESGRSLAATDTNVAEQEKQTGSFGDVGEWDATRAGSLLSRGATDWAVTDDDAQKVYDMIATAAPATRGGLVLQLDRMGKLGRLCDNLPWRWVQQLHDVVEDPAAKAKLRPYFEDKGGGESLTKVYEQKIMKNLEEDHYARAYLWTFLNTAHNALTFGFKNVHDGAYDANQEGWISDDAYYSTTAKGLGRAAAMMAATAATGGAAGAWGEGVALGLGAGKTMAQIIGGAVGGGAAGVTGQFTADVYDQLLMGKQGFSSIGDYGTAAATGAVGGALTAGVAAAGSKFLPESMKTMSQVYAERYPGLDNALTRIRSSGVRQGLVLRVTGQELQTLMSSGLAGGPNLDAALERIAKVNGNSRIDVNNRTLAKVHPQSEIEKMFGAVDPATGRVDVRNQNPTSGGYVADAESLESVAPTTDHEVRESLGIDTQATFYRKYNNANDPLFEITFNVSTELDVPLPQNEAPGTPLGTRNPETSHVAGAGVTRGGVPEGKLPNGTPIEIVDIQPVGTPRACYPATGQAYSPYSPAVPSVRNLPAPVVGATAGPDTLRSDD